MKWDRFIRNKSESIHKTKKEIDWIRFTLNVLRKAAQHKFLVVEAKRNEMHDKTLWVGVPNSALLVERPSIVGKLIHIFNNPPLFPLDIVEFQAMWRVTELTASYIPVPHNESPKTITNQNLARLKNPRVEFIEPCWWLMWVNFSSTLVRDHVD